MNRTETACFEQASKTAARRLLASGGFIPAPHLRRLRTRDVAVCLLNYARRTLEAIRLNGG